ncbi:MAG: GH92 family glycosyl hydrolase [Paramuribaculum sp.]|nr:GH92 family glycosyl hydrolase [Paramuribaculum sp.]
MKKNFVAVAGLAALVSCNSPLQNEPELTQFVDPLIGSGGHGHVFVGANVPFGMVQLGPTAITQAWDWTSGYHDSDSSVIGFSHTHLSGTGVGDLFDITVMPVVGNVNYARGNFNDKNSGLWSYAVRSQQIVKPGYYSVPLERYGVKAELTATERVGFHRYTFPATDSAAIVFDLQNGGCWDRPLDTEIIAEGNDMITGHRFSTGWSSDQKVYFAAQFSEPFDSLTLHGKDNMFGRLNFPSGNSREILVKVALSPTSVEAAKANLASEISGWDFDSEAAQADRKWNRELAKIVIQSNDTVELTKFYTSLYHTMFMPAIMNDVDSVPAFTTYSLWDTYRAEMPLLTIIQPKLSADMVNDMIAIFNNQGRLPVWHLWGCETDCMVGNPGIIPVADAVVKNLPGVDASLAMKAMIVTANDTARGGKFRQKYGYIPCNLFNEAVAYDMEYAIADAAIANAAKIVGDIVVEHEFTRRSRSYRNYFDKSTGFIRGKDSQGEWRTPFDPYSTTHRVDDYCEGNAWQYTWLAPHDIEGLRDCFGSNEAMIGKLDSLFAATSVLTGDASPDITGLIGQYAHGNEPGHHTPYIYGMLGEPEKTADLVTRILDEMYSDKPDGLCGNEDAGQMSAWYIFSALGFYPVEPAAGKYQFGTPRYERVEIAVPGGVFVIKAPGVSQQKRHIKSVKLNGKQLTDNFISHSDIMSGGILEFEMTH